MARNVRGSTYWARQWVYGLFLRLFLRGLSSGQSPLTPTVTSLGGQVAALSLEAWVRWEQAPRAWSVGGCVDDWHLRFHFWWGRRVRTPVSLKVWRKCRLPCASVYERYPIHKTMVIVRESERITFGLPRLRMRKEIKLLKWVCSSWGYLRISGIMS
mgnify:CR=1 FL=1